MSIIPTHTQLFVDDTVDPALQGTFSPPVEAPAPNHTELLLAYLIAITHAATTDAGRTAIIAAGLIGPITAYLTVENSALKTQAVDAISNLALSDAGRQEIIATDSTKRLVTLLATTNPPEIQAKAARALMNISGSINGCRKIKEAGGILALQALSTGVEGNHAEQVKTDVDIILANIRRNIMTDDEDFALFRHIMNKIADKARTIGFALPHGFEQYQNASTTTCAGGIKEAISAFTHSEGIPIDPKLPETITIHVLLKAGLFDRTSFREAKQLADDFFAATERMGNAATQLCDYQGHNLTIALEPFIALANSPAGEPFDFRRFGVPRTPENEFVTQAIDYALAPSTESADLIEFIRVRGAQIVAPENASTTLTALLLKKQPDLLNSFIKAGLLTSISDEQLEGILTTAILETQGAIGSSPFIFHTIHYEKTPVESLQTLIKNTALLNKPHVCDRAVQKAQEHPDWPEDRPEVDQALRPYPTKITHCCSRKGGCTIS